ncbi:MAG: DUF2723 domain-containing protein [Alistipes sp.]|nr:DUF2723 domain-containing protein [Alistipes sp.]
MNRSSFRFWDNVVGWLVFAIATISYWATMEPTTSLWDCSEYIATSYKLEVGHPPGAPLYMMLARLASLFAPSPEYVPLMINAMNCLVSGFTILFMFWTVTHLARRVVQPAVGEMSTSQMVMVLGSGAVGALSYAYTDTFWFSAVEGEVYAMSSMFTALVVWLMLKWEENADSPTSMRWIILIAYLMGLSIGVHILNLLTIPALVMIYFFRRYKSDDPWQYALYIILALVVSMLILGAINGIIIPYTVLLGAYFDTFAVNTLDMPVNAGMLIFAFLVFTGLGVLIYFSHKRKWRVTNVVALCVTVILLGFSSYAMMTIRANANPPMNSNNPSNPHMLLSVLNRDQYGARPLLKGVYYGAKPLPTVSETGYCNYQTDGNGRAYVDMFTPTGNLITTTTMWYNPETKRYEERVSEVEYTYPDEAYHYFPRMWYHLRSNDYAQYIDNPEWCYDARVGSWMEPSRGDDFAYFMDYQMGDMFWRYFMWNFVGRQDDIQLQKCRANDGTYLHGGWLSGIDFIDENFCGPQDKLPSDMKSNPGRNTYFFLPLLLGLLGLIYHLIRDWRNWFVVLLLFVLMGVALVVYFNTAPNEPRERDYVYAGAFYAFSIWIGLGVLGVAELFVSIGKLLTDSLGKAYRNVETVAVSLALLFCMSVPMVLAAQNWDDHDRSERYFARDIGWNYLNSAPENAIIINYGDNDTFPLWYCQEVEGVRPDVKVMNSSYLDGEWYIDQMKIASNSADGVPFTIPTEKYTKMDGSLIVTANADDYIFITDEDMLKERNNIFAIIRKEYTFEYDKEYDSVTKRRVPRTMTLGFSEVLSMFDDLYQLLIEFEDKAPLTREEQAQYDESVKKYIALRDVIYGEVEHPFREDYDSYFAYYDKYGEFYDLCTPQSLPLADAIALYKSDEPMWLIKSNTEDRWRIVERGERVTDIPEGYTLCCELCPKIDSPFSGEPIDYLIGAKTYTIPVDAEAAVKAGIITKEDVSNKRVCEEIAIKIPNNFISRGQLMMYDLLGNYDWSRPICFTQPFLMEDYGIDNYARFDGYCYTFVPMRSSARYGDIDIDRLYPLYMNECEPKALNKALRFGNLADEDVLADYFVRYNVRASGVMGHFARIAEKLISRGGDEDFEKAEKLLDRGLAVLPPAKVGYLYNDHISYVFDYYDLAERYAAEGDKEAAKRCYGKGVKLNGAMARYYAEWVNYYLDYVNAADFKADISTKIFTELKSMIRCMQVADSYDNKSLNLYREVLNSCGKHNPEYLATRFMQQFSGLVPAEMVSEAKAKTTICSQDISNELQKYQSQQKTIYFADYLSAQYFHIAYILDEMAYMGWYGAKVLRDGKFNTLSCELLDKLSYDVAYEPYHLKSDELVAPASKVSSDDSEQLSPEVQGVMDIYLKGLDAWGRATEYAKKAVEMMAPRLNIEINVKYEDAFQYFYAFSDYAAEMVQMANARGVDIADAMEQLALSDEEYALADDYLKMGDKAAIELIAKCAAKVEPLIDSAERDDYTEKDISEIYVNMLDIVDVLSVSHSVAGSFDWVANDVGYNGMGVEQVSFDELMTRYVAMATRLVNDSSTDRITNTYLSDIALRAYSLLPVERESGAAVYAAAMEAYLTHPAIESILKELYK